MRDLKQRPVSVFREFLDGEAAGGIILMVAAALALIVANSPLVANLFLRSPCLSRPAQRLALDQ